MITTAVQQASQMVEIQGAPPTVQAAGGDFRETFTANVSTPVGQQGGQSQKNQASGLATASVGLSATKQALAADLSLKISPVTTTKSLTHLADAAIDDESPKQAVETSSRDLKTGLELTLSDARTTESIAGDNLRSAVLTPVGNETAGSAKAVTSALRAASASTVAPKQEDQSESVDAAAAKGAQTIASGPKKDLSFARAETIASGTSSLSVADQALLSASVSVVPLSTPLSSYVTASTIASPNSSGAVTATNSLSDALARSTQSLDGAIQFAGKVGSASAETATTDASSAVPGTRTHQQSKVKDTNISSDLDATQAKVAVPTSAPAAVAQKKAIPYSGPALQASHDAEASTSKAIDTVQDPATKLQNTGPATGLQATSTAVSLTGGEPVTTQAAFNPPIKPDVLQGATAAASLQGGPSKINSAVVKDAKAKTSADGAGDDTATTSTTLLGETPSALSSPAVLGASVGGRVATATDVAVPVALATPHPVGASTHATSTVAARVQGSVNVGQITDAASSSTQVGDPHRTLLATPTTLEVGVQSGAQGWLRIRAEVGDQGAVNASLAAGTSAGKELLHSQIPALNAFLHSEQIAVTTTVTDRGSLTSGSGVASGSGGLGSGDGSGSNGSLLEGGGAQSDQARQDSSSPAMGLSASDSVRSHDARSGATGTEGSSSNRTMISAESGRWLNVRV